MVREAQANMPAKEQDEELAFELFLLDEERAEKDVQDAISAITEYEWVDIFPEVRAHLPLILRERERDAAELKEAIKSKLRAVKDGTPVEKYRARLSILIAEGNELAQVMKDVARLKRQINYATGKWTSATRGRISEADIVRARAVPITRVLNLKERRSGKVVMAKCPLHPDKTPSFAVYGDNHFHCFGCSAHGDVITLIQKRDNVSFVDAVKRINNYA